MTYSILTTFTCPDCGEMKNTTESRTVRKMALLHRSSVSKIVCASCFRSRYTACSCCNRFFRASESRDAFNQEGNMVTLCLECVYNGKAWTCHHCSSTFTRDQMSIRASENGDRGTITICRECYESYYFTCIACHGVFPSSRAGGEDGFTCDSCTLESIAAPPESFGQDEYPRSWLKHDETTKKIVDDGDSEI